MSSRSARKSVHANERPRPTTEVRLGFAFSSIARARPRRSEWCSRSQTISCFFEAGIR